MRRTKVDADKTRESILNSAYELFAIKGYSNTSIVDIVKTTTFTRGAVYWHFNSKLDIYEEIIRRRLQEIQQEIEGSFRSGMDIDEILRASIQRLTSDSKYYFVNQAIALRAAHEELIPIAAEVERVKRIYYDFLHDFIASCFQRQGIQGVDTHRFIKYIYTIFEGTYQFIAQGVMVSPLSQEDLDFYVGMIMGGIEGNADHLF